MEETEAVGEVNLIPDEYLIKSGDLVNVSIPIDVYGDELPYRLIETIFSVDFVQTNGDAVLISTGSEEDHTFEQFLMPYKHISLFREGGVE